MRMESRRETETATVDRFRREHGPMSERENVDFMAEAMAAEVVPCRYMQPDQKFGHGWAVAVIDGQPRCEACVEWLSENGGQTE